MGVWEEYRETTQEYESKAGRLSRIVLHTGKTLMRIRPDFPTHGFKD